MADGLPLQTRLDRVEALAESWARCVVPSRIIAKNFLSAITEMEKKQLGSGLDVLTSFERITAFVEDELKHQDVSKRMFEPVNDAEQQVEDKNGANENENEVTIWQCCTL